MRSLAFTIALIVTTVALPAAPAEAADTCDVAPVNGAYSFPAECSGSVRGGFGTPSDGWTFRVPERSRVLFELENHGTAFGDTILLDLDFADGTHVVGPSVAGGRAGRITGVAETAGAVVLWANGFGFEEHDLPYTLRAWLEPAPPPLPPQDDCGTGRDAIGEWGSTRIVAPIDCHGLLPRTDDPYGYGNDLGDNYDFVVHEGDTLVVRSPVPPGVTMCVSLWRQDDIACRSPPTGGPASPLDATFQVREDQVVDLWLDREWDAAGAEYDFTVDLIPPIWHTDEHQVRVDIGGPQRPFVAFTRPDRAMFGNLTVPDGFLVEWVQLAVPVQPGGRVEVTWDAPLPADVRLVLADENVDLTIGCEATGERTIVCDRASDTSWDFVTGFGTIQWAGIVVERGIHVDATVTLHHWTYA